MNSYPQPPLPKKLREILADYPDLIDGLQEVLNSSAERSHRIPLMPFDDAIWALDDLLGSFLCEARDELTSAETTGDARLVDAAMRKKSAVSTASVTQLWITDDDFSTYFREGFR